MNDPSWNSPTAAVTAMYRAILNRDPDSGGLEGYVKALASGFSYEAIMREMITSAEFGNGQNKRGTFNDIETLQKPPTFDRFWMETREAAKGLIDPSVSLFAPQEFMDLFAKALPIFLLDESSLKKSAWFILQKREADRVGAAVGEMLKAEFDAVFANEVFVILARKGLAVQPMDFPAIHAEALWARFEEMRKSAAIAVPPVALPAKCAALMSAYNRPWALARSLPQVMRLGCPVLVVEDGSDQTHEAAYRKIRDEHPSVHWLAMPENRGVTCVVNVGVSYWLSDADMEWISYFDEDVDVHPDLLRRLALVQDREKRPLLTGRRSPEHPAVGKDEINGVQVVYLHSTTGHHLHAHRDYCSRMLPMPPPTPAFTGSKKTGYGDWWAASWAPESVISTGRKIVCLPGLVSAFATKPEDSSWGNTSFPDEGLLDG
jgi:Domain of unknown function (DUF4214)/Glycosyl transferase family 2